MSEFFIIVPIMLAITATVLAFIFIVPEKKRAELNGFGKFVHDLLNFKFLIIEKVLQALYIFATATVILFGFLQLFHVQKGYFSNHWYGGTGLLIMILGPIAVRIVYELLMMTILLIKNVIQINNKIKNENADNKEDVFNAPVAPIKDMFTPKAAPEAPVAKNTCAACGKEVNPSSTFCPYCGTKQQ